MIEKRKIMPVAALKKNQSASNVTVVRKVKDYSKEPAFKKKAADALAFIKKHGLPKAFKKKK